MAEGRLLPGALLLLLLLLWAGAAGAQPDSSCPAHCVCQNLSDSLSTLCAHKGLLSVPANIDRRTVELRLADNFIRAVGAPDFLNMSGLVDLTLSRNAIGAVGPFAFGDLESLRSLHLDGNRLTELRAEALRGLLNLQHLILSNNQLAAIAGGAFDDFLPTLEDLDLSYNNLPAVPWEGIGAMFCLHTLNLDHNLIGSVREGAFAELYKLSRLDMTSNRLHTLPPDPLFARAQLGVVSPTPYTPTVALSFGGNPLHCNCELLWLRRLARPDDLETCASPAQAAGRYFWSVPEEEFACEPPLITRHTHRLWVLEGQRATLRCRAIGDPEPLVHWVSPDDRIVGNSSRTASFRNGTLDLFVTTLRDGGGYTCIAINAAGEATATVNLQIIPLPHRGSGGGGGGGGGGRGNGSAPQADPGSSDIASSSSSAAAAKAGGSNGSAAEGPPERRVEVSEVTASSALVRWAPDNPASAAWMFQVQYNCTVDDTLVYRILPAARRHFRLRHLVPSVDYDLCVLAIFDDPGTALAATHLLGCARFSTGEAYPDCRALHAHFLGGTLTVIVGGVIVATLLVFTAAMMVRHKVCGGARAAALPKVAHAHAQTNGGGGGGGGAGGAGHANGLPLLLPAPQRTAPKEPRPGRAKGGPAKRSRAKGAGRGGAAPAWPPPPSSSSSSKARARAKRSSSLDMGGPPSAAASSASSSSHACYSYAKRLSLLWAQRSHSVHGMLAQCAGAPQDMAAKGAGPFLSADELEESVV